MPLHGAALNMAALVSDTPNGNVLATLKGEDRRDRMCNFRGLTPKHERSGSNGGAILLILPSTASLAVRVLSRHSSRTGVFAGGFMCRGHFLGVLGAAVAFTACRVDPPLDERPWALTVAEDINPDPDVVEVELAAGDNEIAIVEGRPTAMWTYNGSFPGPLIEANVGDRVVVHFENGIGEGTTIHWHGLRVPAAMDGVLAMQDAIEDGESFTYEFVVPDALLAWYHPHMRSDVAVERGLQAPFVVRAPDARSFGRETIVVLDDVLLDDDGSLTPFAGHMESMSGRIGNTILVNGHRRPVLEIRSGEAQHLRLVNTANARTMVVRLPGRMLTWIGSDGGLFAEARDVDSVSLSPGERADIVFSVDDPPGSETDIEVGAPSGGMTMMGGEDSKTYKSLHIRVVEGDAQRFDAVPQALADIPTLPDSVRERTLRFDGGMMGGGMMGGGDGAMSFTINGESWPDVTPLDASIGDIETWTLENRTGVAHPFHLHGNRFQVVGLQFPKGWKDNVLVPANEDVRIRVSLDGSGGRWMFHCHILEHAENGMMGELDLE